MKLVLLFALILIALLEDASSDKENVPNQPRAEKPAETSENIEKRSGRNFGIRRPAAGILQGNRGNGRPRTSGGGGEVRMSPPGSGLGVGGRMSFIGGGGGKPPSGLSGGGGRPGGGQGGKLPGGGGGGGGRPQGGGQGGKPPGGGGGGGGRPQGGGPGSKPPGGGGGGKPQGGGGGRPNGGAGRPNGGGGLPNGGGGRPNGGGGKPNGGGGKPNGGGGRPNGSGGKPNGGGGKPNYSFDTSTPYYGPSLEQSLMDITETLRDIPHGINEIRSMFFDIQMLLGSLNSKSAIEMFMTSITMVDIDKIFPENTDYSIIGSVIVAAIDAFRVEDILSSAENFFSSDAMYRFATNLSMYHDDGYTPVMDHILDSVKDSQILDESIKQFNNITWLRVFFTDIGQLPWMQQLMSSVGKVFDLEECFSRIEEVMVNCTIDWYGGCFPLGILARCADEVWASVDQVKMLQGELAENNPKYTNTMYWDTDPTLVTMGVCIASDPYCTDHSVDYLSQYMPSSFNDFAKCSYTDANAISCDQNKDVQEYVQCLDKVCGGLMS